MQTCIKCDISKPLDDFYLSKDGKGNQYRRRTCKACILAKSKNQSPEYRLDARLWSFYRMRLVDYEAMLANQNYQCAICSTKISRSTGYVDHDHNCCPSERTCGNCIRGLLCQNCNTGIGVFGDDVQRLQSAIRYLSN